LDYFRENRHAAVARLERIIEAIGPDGRQNPELIGPGDIQRIAASCGLKPEDIELFLRQFERLRERMWKIAGLGLWQRLLLVLGLRRLPEAGEE
jgi:signal recognition particle subunit SRP54